MPTTADPAAWIKKANKIIAALCWESYAKANLKEDGTKRKRHVPYSVPPLAAALVECLGTQDEERAKGLFYYLEVCPAASRGD